MEREKIRRGGVVGRIKREREGKRNKGTING